MLRLSSIDRVDLGMLLGRYELELALVPSAESIPSSYWGDCEAGLRGDQLFARLDTPVHSVLHEASHYICMTPERRTHLDRDAGGNDAEEGAVCYLQILLADQVRGVGRQRLCEDMDEWGYSFRLGSTRAWFSDDADDARTWLAAHSIIDSASRLTWSLRC